MKQLEFFFDCASPWTYLAFRGVQALAGRRSLTLCWKPILVGGVFNEVNPQVYEHRASPNPRRLAYTEKDLDDWTRHYGLRFSKPKVFPVNSVKAMRGALVAGEEGCLPDYAEAVFSAYWCQSRDISDRNELLAVVTGLGMDGKDFLRRIAEPHCKDALRANTDELIRRGGFGSPTMFWGDDMYFGNDRLWLLEQNVANGR